MILLHEVLVGYYWVPLLGYLRRISRCQSGNK